MAKHTIGLLDFADRRADLGNNASDVFPENLVDLGELLTVLIVNAVLTTGYSLTKIS